jgi:hypothetical protein|tara:strand:- start:999 stop:1400 length:402 start_codon:yes stop_codon:yes gene_type:complete
MKLNIPKLAEIAFVVYATLIIIVLEIYDKEYNSEEHFTAEEVTATPAPASFPELGYLPRSMWKQANYAGQSVTPIPGTKIMDPIEMSYSQTSEIQLANPFIREEACLPIEGNIGMKIDIACEIFGPFERKFIL